MGRTLGSKNKKTKEQDMRNRTIFRIDMDVDVFLRSQKNMGAYINNLIRKDMEQQMKLKKMEESDMGKRYYVSTCDYAGNFNGLLNDNSKGFETDSLDEAMDVYNTEVSYLNSTYEMSEADGSGYYCSILDKEKECIIEMSNNYEV